MTLAIEPKRDLLSDSPPTPTDDRALVYAIADGDHASLRTAYEHYARFVNGVALGILKDPDLASDITQEVFVRLWQRPDRFDADRGSLKAFLQVDAHGRSIDLLRSRNASLRREERELEKQWSTPAIGTEELAMTAVESETVRDAMMKLPEEQRTAGALAFFDGFSYREVAAHLGVPEGTIKSRIRLALRRLEAALGSFAV